MSFNLHNRSLLDLIDFTPRDIRYLLDLASELKRAKAAGNELQRLKGKNIALIFEKASTRTRCAFEVAVHDQGGHVTYIDPVSSQMGHKESIKDTARVLGRLFDGIEYRGLAHRADRTTRCASHHGFAAIGPVGDHQQVLRGIHPGREEHGGDLGAVVERVHHIGHQHHPL